MVTDGITHFAHIQMTRFLSGLGTFSAICQCQQMINCSQVRHCAPHFRMWSAPLSCQPGRLHRSPPWVPVPPTRQQKVMTLQSSCWDERASEISHDFEHMVSQPREWKKAPHSVACISFQLILWPVSLYVEPDKQMSGQTKGAETETVWKYSIKRWEDMQVCVCVCVVWALFLCIVFWKCVRMCLCIVCVLRWSTREGEIMLLPVQEAPD